MAEWKKVVVSGSIAQLANETFISGHITASGTVKAEHLFSTDDAQITDDLIVGGNIDLEGDIDVNGTANLDAVDIDGAVNVAAALTMATTNKIQFRDTAIYINSDADGYLEAVADTGITFKIGSTEQILIADGKIEPTTTNDIDLGSASKKFKNLFLTGDVTASGHAHIVGDITSSAIIKAEHFYSTDDAYIADDLVVDGDIDLDGNIDVNGTANLDAVDIDGAVNIAATTTIATNNKISFRDAAIYLASSADGQLDIVADAEVQIATTTLDINGNVDISGTTAIGDDITVATNKKIQFRDTAIFINSDADGHLELVADTGISFKIGSTEQFILTDGAITPTTTNDVDLGSATKKFKNLFLTGDVTASGHMHVVGDITSSATIKADTLEVTTFSPTNLSTGNITASGYIHAMGDITASGILKGEGLVITDDALITDDLTVNGDIDLAGSIDVDGTMEADAITVGGTALNTVIAGVTVTNSTNAAHVLITDNESTNEENQITFIEGAAGGTANRGLEADGNLTYNPSTGTVSATIFKGNIDAVDGDFDGTLEADAITVGGTALNTVIAGVTVTNSTNAAHVLITDNENTNENNQITFIEGAGGGGANRGLEADGDLLYNPSKGLVIAPNFSASGHIHAAGDITSSAIIKAEHFHSTDDAQIDDDLIVGGSIDLEGDIDVNGTANLDAVDIDGAVNVAAALTMATTNKIQFRDTAIYINSDADGYLEAVADTGITFKIGSTEQLSITDGVLAPTTTNDVDLGSATKKFKNLFLTGDITASGHAHVVGDITASAALKGATGVIAGALAAATLNTGQGANELYAMNQNVRSSDAVVFTTVNTGQGANELYGMDQAVKTNSNVTFADLQVDGDLVVAGTASFTNTTNLEIKDRFISLASGSTSVGDGGIVVNHFGGTYPSGSAFGYEGGTANRWAVQNEFAPTGSTFAPDAYMGIVTFSTEVPTGNPTYGGANYGYGNIHVETDTGDIFIFA